jgi:hypothetical protein
MTDEEYEDAIKGQDEHIQKFYTYKNTTQYKNILENVINSSDTECSFAFAYGEHCGQDHTSLSLQEMSPWNYGNWQDLLLFWGDRDILADPPSCYISLICDDDNKEATTNTNIILIAQDDTLNNKTTTIDFGNGNTRTIKYADHIIVGEEYKLMYIFQYKGESKGFRIKDETKVGKYYGWYFTARMHDTHNIPSLTNKANEVSDDTKASRSYRYQRASMYILPTDIQMYGTYEVAETPYAETTTTTTTKVFDSGDSWNDQIKLDSLHVLSEQNYTLCSYNCGEKYFGDYGDYDPLSSEGVLLSSNQYNGKNLYDSNGKLLSEDKQTAISLTKSSLNTDYTKVTKSISKDNSLVVTWAYETDYEVFSTPYINAHSYILVGKDTNYTDTYFTRKYNYGEWGDDNDEASPTQVLSDDCPHTEHIQPKVTTNTTTGEGEYSYTYTSTNNEKNDGDATYANASDRDSSGNAIYRLNVDVIEDGTNEHIQGVGIEITTKVTKVYSNNNETYYKVTGGNRTYYTTDANIVEFDSTQNSATYETYENPSTHAVEPKPYVKDGVTYYKVTLNNIAYKTTDVNIINDINNNEDNINSVSYELEDKVVSKGDTSILQLDVDEIYYGYIMETNKSDLDKEFTATITNVPSGYVVVKDTDTKTLTDDNNIANLNDTNYNISLTLKKDENGTQNSNTTSSSTSTSTSGSTSKDVTVTQKFTYTYSTGVTYDYSNSCYKKVEAKNADGSLKKDDAGKQVYEIKLDCKHTHSSSCFKTVSISERDHANCGDIGFDDRHVIHTPNVEGEKKTYGILERCHFFSLIFFSSKANACVDT